MSGVTAPGAKGILRPEEREHAEQRAYELMKQLLQRQPEAPETAARGRLRRDGANDRRHTLILAQVAKLYESAVNRLETTRTPALVSNWTES
jgi:hypothetical protein